VRRAREPARRGVKAEPVAPKLCEINGDFVDAAPRNEFAAVVVAKPSQRGSKRSACAICRQFGPEKRSDLVPAMESGRPRGSQEGQ
jgi:hypothetical protein